MSKQQHCPRCDAYSDQGLVNCIGCGRGFKAFIVGEITKNWTRGIVEAKPLLCQEFEAMIEHNEKRGYRLYDFQLHQIMDGNDPEVLSETIIAVFERVQ